MKSSINRGLIILAALFAEGIYAVPIDLSKTENKVEFLAVGTPSAIKIRGKLGGKKALNGSIEIIEKKLNATVKVQLDALDTGIAMRDRHMKEKYLETAKHPESVLTISSLDLSGNPMEKGFSYAGPFEGKLSLHGVGKMVTGKLKLTKSENKWQGEFAFSVELEEFGIEIPSYMGIKVSKSVQIEAAFKE